MSRIKRTIGLVGFGCVGRGVFELIEKTPGIEAEIKRIAIRQANKERGVDQRLFTTEVDELINDSSINTIVEVIDDADAAYSIVVKALKAGKAVVSANKKMIASHFEELLHLQREYGQPLLYEAASCASVPIIRNLEEYYDNDLLESIEGIVNGSSNYILTNVVNQQISFQDALLDAIAQGYAESDPSLDIGGFDAKFKLSILIAHAFGVIVHPDGIVHLGIENLDHTEFDFAHARGYKIKQVAFADKDERGEVRAFVLPKFISPDDSLYHVDGVFNGVKTKTYFSDSQFFLGRGAGSYPTASAILSDLSALTYDYRYEYKKLQRNDGLKVAGDVLLKVYLRYSGADDPLSAKWLEIDEQWSGKSAAYKIGTVKLSDLQTLKSSTHNGTVVLLEVMPTSHRDLEITSTKLLVAEEL